MKNLNYSSVKEMIQVVNDRLPKGVRVVDGWQENKYYVLEIGSKTTMANIRIKLLMPE